MTRQDILDKAVIGIEWEPQFTFLAHPGYQAVFENVITTGGARKFLSVKVVSDKKKRGIMDPEYAQFYSSQRLYLMINNAGFTKFITKIGKEIFSVINAGEKKPDKKEFLSKLLYSLGLDGNNIEVRTMASGLKQLPDSIKIADYFLGLLVKKLNKYLPGGVASFLPKTTCFSIMSRKPSVNPDGSYSPQAQADDRTTKYINVFIPTKHVNITFKNMLIYGRHWSHKQQEDLIHFRPKISFKDRVTDHSTRLHITVPYNFTDYSGLVDVGYYLYKKVYEHENTLGRELNLSGSDRWTPHDIDVTPQCNKIVKFLDEWAKQNPMEKPILLKYMKNKKLVTSRGLI